MKISWLKSNNDNSSFRFFEKMGMDVFSIKELEDTDKKIEELINKDYKTIIISNEIASFSEDIITKYSKSDNINIIIAPSKKNTT